MKSIFDIEEKAEIAIMILLVTGLAVLITVLIMIANQVTALEIIGVVLPFSWIAIIALVSRKLHLSKVSDKDAVTLLIMEILINTALAVLSFLLFVRSMAA